MTVEEKAYNYASKVAKNRLTASEVAAHYGRGYIEGREDMKQLGWHTASELPPVGENGNSIDLIAIDEDNEPIKVSYNKFYKCWVMADVTAETFDKITIKWWCYPPKED
jgi:hypothetical protein